jgi:hypothetical protein
MRKLKLQVEELVVDSFEAVGNRTKAPGTVHGYETIDGTCGNWTCQANISCAYACSNACGTLHDKTCDGPTCNSPDCIDPI